MDLVHRDRVALDLIRISLPRHGGKLPLPDPTQQEAEVSTKQGQVIHPLTPRIEIKANAGEQSLRYFSLMLEKLPGLFFPFPLFGLPALAPSSTLCLADVDDPTRNKRPRKRNPHRARKSNETDAESCHAHIRQRR